MKLVTPSRNPSDQVSSYNQVSRVTTQQMIYVYTKVRVVLTREDRYGGLVQLGKLIEFKAKVQKSDHYTYQFKWWASHPNATVVGVRSVYIYNRIFHIYISAICEFFIDIFIFNLHSIYFISLYAFF